MKEGIADGLRHVQHPLNRPFMLLLLLLIYHHYKLRKDLSSHLDSPARPHWHECGFSRSFDCTAIFLRGPSSSEAERRFHNVGRLRGVSGNQSFVLHVIAAFA